MSLTFKKLKRNQYDGGDLKMGDTFNQTQTQLRLVLYDCKELKLGPRDATKNWR